MSASPPRKDLNLRWLELFQSCAEKGSLKAAAEEAGVSVSTVSHHLRSLEAHLGVALFNHDRRPMTLTPKGQAFLRNIDGALLSIRKAKAEASAGTVTEAGYLRIGTIEDFDSDITPELAVYLSEQMPECGFLYHTATSREILAMLHDRKLDIGITTRPPERMRDLRDIPLIRDPFVAVLPASCDRPLTEVIPEPGALPYLQFSNDLIIAQQIEAQLRRLGLTLPRRFECANNQTLMAMVAAGAGWTITTPLLFSRARRFQPNLRMVPFPGKRFARTLSIVATPDCARSVLTLIERTVRASLEHHVIGALKAQAPWLQDQFGLIDPDF